MPEGIAGRGVVRLGGVFQKGESGETTADSGTGCFGIEELKKQFCSCPEPTLHASSVL